MDNKERKQILRNIGIRPDLLGFKYIVSAWEEIERNGGEMYITSELYPIIAEKYDTTAKRVERAIRHAIEILYKDQERIREYYKRKPTNSLFLYDLYEFRGENIK